MMVKRVTLCCLLILLLSYISVVAANVEEPKKLVMSVASETISRLKADKDLIKKDSKHVHQLINELLIPHFDFEKMAKWTMGRHWRKANATQKNDFIEEFKSLLIRTYATSLTEYSDQKIDYLPMRDSESSDDVTVRSEIKQGGGFPIPIDYDLHKVNGEWKVYDVKIDEISLIANYRTSFSRQIKRIGIDGLIKKLATKNR